MNINAQTIIGELVAEDYRTATVFKNNDIDFCCNGNRTIEDACIKKNIEPATLLSDLENSMTSINDRTPDYNNWPLDLLADYIEKKHHRYVKKRINEMLPFLNKIAKVHGDKHPELNEIEQLFNECAAELTQHMHKEEMMLFPYIRRLVTDNNLLSAVPFDSVQIPIEKMMDEHESEGERFRKISLLTNNYTVPSEACNTYKVSFSMLKEFEEDLHLHIHLENNILFPNAIKLELSKVESKYF